MRFSLMPNPLKPLALRNKTVVKEQTAPVPDLNPGRLANRWKHCERQTEGWNMRVHCLMWEATIRSNSTMRTWLAKTLVALALATAFDAAKANELEARALTIVAFGDSTTARHRLVKRVYSDRLPHLLGTHGIKAKVINAGVGSSHTGVIRDHDRHRGIHARDRLDRDVIRHQPEIVIVQFGWNDSWVHGEEQDGVSAVPLDAYISNLKTIIRKVRASGSSVILLTPNPPRNQVVAWRKQRTANYAQATRIVAEDLKTPLLDVWLLFEKQPGNVNRFLRDKIHPNDEGHELIAELLARRIIKLAGER